MVHYFFNFWVWWYAVNTYDLAKNLVSKWTFILNYMNLPAMAGNLFAPLYQDRSIVGRFISFVIRTVWILFGAVVMIVITGPLLAVYGIYLLLPLMPLFAILGTFINWV